MNRKAELGHKTVPNVRVYISLRKYLISRFFTLNHAKSLKDQRAPLRTTPAVTASRATEKNTIKHNNVIGGFQGQTSVHQLLTSKNAGKNAKTKISGETIT